MDSILEENVFIAVTEEQVFNVVSVSEDSTFITTGIVGPQGPKGEQGIQGETGPQGPQGGANIGGYAISLNGEAANDVLAFNGTVWINRKQESLADGGNF